MTKDEVMQAIRLTAMGRAGHPLQEELAQLIADLQEAQKRFEETLLATPEQRADEEMAQAGIKKPGRPKKAE